MASFSVVEFVGEGSMETIPSKWLTPTKENALWPEGKNYTKIKKLLKGDFNLSEGKWKKVAVRVMGSADSYFIAKTIEQKFEFTSSCETDVELLPPKRIIKRKRYSSDTEEEIGPFQKQRREIPAFPRAKQNYIQSASVHDESLDLSTEHCVDLVQNSPSRYLEDSPCRTPFEISQSGKVVGNVQLQLTDFNANEAFQARLFKKLEDISYELKALRKDVGNIQTQVALISNEQFANSTCEQEIEFLPLPISSTNELIEIEEFLKVQKNFTNMVVFLSKLGGGAVRDMTYNCMNKVFGSDIACTYSLYGKKGKNAFCQLLIYKAILSAVKMALNCTECEINKRIGLFLAGAKDRNGGRKERNSKFISCEIIQSNEL